MLDALRMLPPTVDLVLVAGGVDTVTYGRTARGRVKRALGLPFDSLGALRHDAARLDLSHRIHVTGFRRDVARVLAAADVLAFPSLAPEGFGRPIIEAMATARPVVATNIGPSAELLGPDAGRLVPPDASSMAEAIAELLWDPGERMRMGSAGRQRVEAYFGLDCQVSQMSALYREVVGIA
jgi:glycosyltransferase involved in cell wall biosynthesis